MRNNHMRMITAHFWCTSEMEQLRGVALVYIILGCKRLNVSPTSRNGNEWTSAIVVCAHALLPSVVKRLASDGQENVILVLRLSPSMSSTSNQHAIKCARACAFFSSFLSFVFDSRFSIGSFSSLSIGCLWLCWEIHEFSADIPLWLCPKNWISRIDWSNDDFELWTSLCVVLVTSLDTFFPLKHTGRQNNAKKRKNNANDNRLRPVFMPFFPYHMRWTDYQYEAESPTHSQSTHVRWAHKDTNKLHLSDTKRW